MGLRKITTLSLNLPSGVSLFQKTYEALKMPDGVKVFKTPMFFDEYGGFFKESLRINDLGEVVALKELGVSFKVRQSMISCVAPGTKRFWHINPDKGKNKGQNQFWVTNGTLNLGLIDLRKNSSSYLVKSKIVLSADKAVFVPAGIAQGFINPNSFPVSIVYYIDQWFTDGDNTQEHVIDPRELPYDFVLPELS